ncbi:site-specific integrase [Sulfurimonas sp.]|uniref:tyrosine-type recombinase/integrase n=1 Tax=Sulfurimonas sp. TaxID=2022749 RepID=UPI0025D5C41C|nr:site-specific integrase [Sulfurimonas sp.]MCK9455584.1 site-specific integrase [Sulfurimonas sp.]
MAKSNKREKVNYLDFTFTIFEKYDKWQISFYPVKGQPLKKKTTGLEATASNLIIVKREIIPSIVEYLTGKVELFVQKEDLCVQEWAEEFFIVHKDKVRSHVYKRNLGHYNNHIKPYFGDKLLHLIKPIDIEKWQNKLLKEFKHLTVQKYRSVFLSIFDYAVKNEVVESNPIRKVESPKTIEKVTMHDNDEENDIFPFSEAEIKTLLEKADGYLKNFIMLMYASGIRPGEIIALSWNDIDFNKKQINIYKTIVNGKIGPVKTQSSKRKIDMLPLAEMALKEQYKITSNNEYIFISNQKKLFYSHDIINVRLKKVLKANKIQVRKLYNLRHTFASQLIAAGEDITWVSKTLGHKDAQTTLMYYTKFIKKGENERLEKISKIGANFGANIFDSGLKADK